MYEAMKNHINVLMTFGESVIGGSLILIFLIFLLCK